MGNKILLSALRKNGLNLISNEKKDDLAKTIFEESKLSLSDQILNKKIK